jgi:hypothetical protein
VIWVAVGALVGCTGKKQVPFGLEETEPVDETDDGDSALEEAQPPRETLAEGTRFQANQVEVPVGEAALVLSTGYALTALELDLDGEEPTEAIVISADGQEVTAQVAAQRGLTVASKPIASFLVPDDCTDPAAQIRQLSESLVVARVEHDCDAGQRTNLWILTVEAQPRVRERITVLPTNAASGGPIELALSVADRDGDRYEDLVANVRIEGRDVPLVWLNRPGGFARDTSEPEATLRLLADDAWAFADSDLDGSAKRAQQVLAAFVAMCRESGSARIGLGGVQGIQCGRSPAAARAVSVATVAAIRRGMFVEALQLQRWWSNGVMQPSAEERALVEDAWKKAKASANASWRLVDRESAAADLYFRDAETLVIDGFAPRSVALKSGEKKGLSTDEPPPPVRNPDGRFAVRDVRVTCAGFEAEIGPVGGKRSHRVLIDRRPGSTPCQVPVDRPATVFEWAVLGWAPQGLLAASGDLLRIIPLNEDAKAAGRPMDLDPGTPLPAPVRGARITPNGARYVIPHPEGVVVRDWRGGGSGRWLRPADWNAVPGELRAVAISPDGRHVAVQKGTEIRVLSW